VQLLANWDREQADTDIMGYVGPVLAMRTPATPDHRQFAADPDVTGAEEAARNNERPETKAWARNPRVIEGEPVYHHYDELYRS
jgi:hypothetical protein